MTPRNGSTLSEITRSSLDASDIQKELDWKLWEAVETNNQEIIKLLLAAKANPNFEKEKCPILLKATYSENIEIVRSLLDAKANVNNTYSGRSALFIATLSKNKNVVQLLLDQKADPNIETNNEKDALYWAATLEQFDLVAILILGGANPALKKFSTLELLLSMDPFTDIEGNFKENKTDNQLEEALATVNLLLNKGSFLSFPRSLYKFLLVCDQKHPYVFNSFTKLCEQAEKPTLDKEYKNFNKKHVYEPAKKYLNKLEVVLKHHLFPIDSPKKLTAKKVEELYDKICAKKHPFWSMLAPLSISIEVKPEEINRSLTTPKI